MENVGEILKNARLQSGQSLEQVEEATSIRKIYLSAIENGDYKKIPGDVFTKGIIRTYGNYLNLNGPELVTLYKAAISGIDPEELKPLEIRTTSKISIAPHLKPQKNSSNSWKYLVVLLVVTIVGIGLFFFVGTFDKNVINTEKLATTQSEQTTKKLTAAEKDKIEAEAKKAKERAEQALATKKNEKTNTQKNKAIPSDKGTAGVNLYLFSNDRCWIEVIADNEKIFEGTLVSNQEKNFSAKEKIIVKYGNIKAMKIAVNGNPEPAETLDGVIVKEYKK